MKVVIVEGAEPMRRQLAEHFEEQGHEVVTFDNGNDVLFYVERFSADLLILAKCLRDVPSVKIIAHVRERGANPVMPVFVLVEVDRNALGVTHSRTIAFAHQSSNSTDE